MQRIKQDSIHLIGLSLKHQTSNANGQSAIDCGALWQEFEKGDYANRIPGKSGDDTLAVYHNYVSDHTGPYNYFIGCKVTPGTIVPDGLDSLIIPEGIYQKITTKGKMPDCVADAWQDIWRSPIKRAYGPHFEIYDERSKDWGNAEVDIMLSVNP